MPCPAGPFHVLLQQLSNEHERQMAELREDNQSLTQKLQESADTIDAMGVAALARATDEIDSESGPRKLPEMPVHAGSSHGAEVVYSSHGSSVLPNLLQEAKPRGLEQAVTHKCFPLRIDGTESATSAAGSELQLAGSIPLSMCSMQFHPDVDQPCSPYQSFGSLGLHETVFAQSSQTGFGSLGFHSSGFGPHLRRLSLQSSQEGSNVVMSQLRLMGPDACGESFLLRTCLRSWFDFVMIISKPLTFALWPKLDIARDVSIVHKHSRLRNSSLPTLPTHKDHAPIKRHQSKCGQMIIPPSCSYRIAWDLFGTALLGYDVITIPLSTFGPEKVVFTRVMDWICLLFWSADMLMSCLTGVMVKGVVSMNPSVILKAYLRSWFAVDVIAVGPDWVFTIMDVAGVAEDAGVASGGRLIRIARSVRTLRLLRLTKLQRVLIMVRDRIDSELTFIIINILQLVAMLLMLNHFLAAVWWSIGTLSRDSGDANWIDSQTLAGEDLEYRYLVALHWSICMFTPGAMPVQPQNTRERAFAIWVLLFGMVVFTSFISSMTAAVGQLKKMQGDGAKEMWMLRRYLRQHSIAKDLSFRVLRYVENAFRQKKTCRLSENAVVAFAVLTDQLRKEVQYEALYCCLNVHPLLDGLSQVIKFRLIGTALSHHHLATADALFSSGGSCTHMNMIVSGDIEYLKVEDVFSTGPASGERAVKGDWFCEHVLWTPWTHVGIARAVCVSELVSISCETFHLELLREKHCKEEVCRYARAFVKQLSLVTYGCLSDLSKYAAARARVWEILEAADASGSSSAWKPKKRHSQFSGLMGSRGLMDKMRHTLFGR